MVVIIEENNMNSMDEMMKKVSTSIRVQFHRERLMQLLTEIAKEYDAMCEEVGWDGDKYLSMAYIKDADHNSVTMNNDYWKHKDDSEFPVLMEHETLEEK